MNSFHVVNEQYKLSHDLLIGYMQKHAPLKPVSRKMHKQKLKSWITKGILKSISIKNKLYKKCFKTKKSDCYQKYKCYRDLINHLTVPHNGQRKFKKKIVLIPLHTLLVRNKHNSIAH